MIITISGKAGSGKSTAAKELAKKLKLKHYSIGDLMRQIAKEKNMSLNELSKSAEKDKSIDLALDKKQIELRDKTDFVIDGRLTAYFIPYANLKVFLECNDKVRAERILKDKREDEKSKSINEITKKIKKREQSERKRYKKLYNVDYYDKKLYDLIIDTTNLNINGVLEKIIKSINEE
ncbi:MAG: cytidylate kinase family protein [Candidatus Woesearchaeota archaeon]|jgi:cytidylate kinase|nr:cytidylate kinase family protein [Candidatus Woesearchaeota archaeon]MDP6265968.1 cytidylate kinase family protein [Candidatus Woesearchaeota archaeon]MDP7322495.1 cytidylate kinase family protein [Candidatus Woesearchaeota archaeon]MDP7476350.1 cytidylate kinase family protein [Candidatus Woesearchaeota archaeon]HJO02066.1 cytidylate kinase family protein [Candidatus Woesearchaeota archaeon]